MRAQISVASKRCCIVVANDKHSERVSASLFQRASSAVQVVTPDQANDLWRGPKGGLATLLVGRAGPDMLELWEWTLFPGEKFQSKGHPKGTVELLSVTEGGLALEIDGVDHLIAASHRAVAMTDRPHVYRCHGKKRTRFAMVVHEPGQVESRRK